jgi:hypothetical protein
MSEPMRYVTDEQGNRIGVVLDLARYPYLASPLVLDADCLVGLSVEELQALANARLASGEQARLSDLLERNSDPQWAGALSEVEVAELDRLLAEGDQLMVLKARARYTLKRLAESPDSILKVS